MVNYFRMSAWCWNHRLRPLAIWLQSCSIRSGGTEIHPAAVLGPGFAIIHTVVIVVGHEAVAGKNLVLYQGVTLGHTGQGLGQPQIGDDVRVGAGAKVLGPVTIGDGAWIGANAVVLADVPAGATVGRVWRKGLRGVEPPTSVGSSPGGRWDRHQVMVVGMESLKVRPLAVHTSAGTRAEGTTVIEPWCPGI